MRTETSETESSIAKRTRRACVESMTVVATGKATFDVYNVEGRRYGVSLVNGTCTCPDFDRRGENLPDGCKHIQRVEMEAGIRDIPDLGRRRLDVEIARSAHARAAAVAMTDGGAVVDSKPQGESTETTHADGCDSPECEGYTADGRPLLSWECWEVWASR